MISKDSVINHLNALRLFADIVVHPVVSPENWDVYSELCDYIDLIKGDIETLLKGQEPRKPYYATLEYLVNGAVVKVEHPECPRCRENGLRLWDAEIEKGQAFCKRCGQKVRWE